MSFRTVFKLFATTVLANTLFGCSTYNQTTRSIAQIITPYKIDIVQGNFISREAVSQLRPGMSRDEVRLLLGTPLINDVFHQNRWDYVFAYRRGLSEVVQQRRYTLFFDADKLVSFGGDELPTEYDLIREIDGIRQPGRHSAAPSRTSITQAEPVPQVILPSERTPTEDFIQTPVDRTKQE